MDLTIITRKVENRPETSSFDVEYILLDDTQSIFLENQGDKQCQSQKGIVHEELGRILKKATGKYLFFCRSVEEINIKELEKALVDASDTKCDILCFGAGEGRNERKGAPHVESGIYEFTNPKDTLDYWIHCLSENSISSGITDKLFNKQMLERVILEKWDIFPNTEFAFLFECTINSSKVVHARRSVLIEGQALEFNTIGFEKALKEIYVNWQVAKTREIPDGNKYFTLLYRLVLNRTFELTKAMSNEKDRMIVDKLLSNIGDIGFFERQIGEFVELIWQLSKYCSLGNAKRIAINLLYIRDKRFLRRKAMNMGRRINPFNNRYDSPQVFEHGGIDGEPKIFLLGSEEYNNLGDHLISISTIEMLQAVNPHVRIVEVTGKGFLKSKDYLKEIIKQDDLIVLTGGGNLGNQYLPTERVRQEVIRTWKKNTKIVFPQTMYYTDDEEGKRELEYAKRVYNSDNNVTVFLREKQSYETVRSSFEVECHIVPDIGLYFARQGAGKRTEDILLCFRNDREKTLGEREYQNLYSLLCGSGMGNLVKSDTVIGYDLNPYQRKEYVSKFLTSLSTTQLVITDRLHGMISAVITGTPCIVFDNSNHKIKESFDWVKHLGYVVFVSTVEDAFAATVRFLNENRTKTWCYDEMSMRGHFSSLLKIVKESVNE